MNKKAFNPQSAQSVTRVIHAHSSWKARIEAIIDGRSNENVSPDILARDDRCELGAWIYGEGRQYLGRNPLFATLCQEHARFHQCAGKAVALAQSGHVQAARQDMREGEFAASARATVGLLTRLYQQTREQA